MTESEKNENVTKAFLEERLSEVMASITRSFDRMEERFQKIDNRLERLENFLINHFKRSEEHHQEFRKTIADHDNHISRQERKIDNLTERVEIIEKRA